MGERLFWDDESVAHVLSRPTRHPGGRKLEPAWGDEVLSDPDLVAFEPDPKSWMGASRFIGFSTGAHRVLVLIAFRDDDGDLHGINVWPATGADLRFYTQGERHGEDH